MNEGEASRWVKSGCHRDIALGPWTLRPTLSRGLPSALTNTLGEMITFPKKYPVVIVK